MIVVSDTSILCYLVLIQQIQLLEHLYGQIVVPTVVRDELLHPSAPSAVGLWASNFPVWVSVRATQSLPDESLAVLDRGEQSAILLAEELQAKLILMDERRGRQLARSRGLRVTGLVGILDDAAGAGLINLPEVLATLQTTSFWVSPRMLQTLLEKYGYNA
jgi:predicted nucleic acid-binding protein